MYHSFVLILKNLRRNKLRLALTTVAVVVFVFMLTFILTIIIGMDELLTEKDKNVKLVISERYRDINGAFKRSDVDRITSRDLPYEELRKLAGFHPQDFAVWHFVGMTVDPEMRNPDLSFFVVATQPEKLYLTDGMEEEVDPRWVDLMLRPPGVRTPGAGIVLGYEPLRKINKRVGDVLDVKVASHRDGKTRQPIEMRLEIVGMIPKGNRWDQAGFMVYDYLDRVLEAEKNEQAGMVHWLWLRVDDQKTAKDTVHLIEKHLPDLKAETSATAYNRFFEPIKPMFWFMKYPLTIAILVVTAVILANTFSMTVRERRGEIALLKVLGFSTTRILVLTLGESLLIGLLGGLLSVTVSFLLVNYVLEGIKLGEQSQRTLISGWAFVWGPLAGLATAFVGGIIPALRARSIQVARVFANAA